MEPLLEEVLSYVNNKFISPNTFTNSINIITNFFNKVSNRLRVNNDVFFCRMERDQLTFKNIRLYPTIYKYSYTDNKTKQVFPTTGNSAENSSCYFDLSTFDSVYIESSKPILTYSSDNELFNLAVLIKDLNKAPLLINYLFEYKDNLQFIDSTTFTSNNSRFTDNFINSSTGNIDLSNAFFPLSSVVPNLSTSKLPISATALIL